MKRFKAAVSLFLRIAISVVLLVVLFRVNNIDIRDIIKVIGSADKVLLWLAFIILSSVFVLGCLRWEMLLKAVHIDLPLRRVIIAFGGGAFFSLFLPSTIGGDLTRTIDLATHTRKAKEVVATVFLDRLSGYVGMVLIAVVAACLGWQHIKAYREVQVGIAVIVSVLLAALVVLFNSSIYNWLNRLLQGPGTGRIREILTSLHTEIHLFRHKRQEIVKSVLLSVLIQSVIPVTSYIIARSLGVHLNILYFFIFLPIVTAVSLIPVSIGGLGIRENMTVFFFMNVGMSKDLALSMSLLQFFFMVIYSGIGGLLYVLSVRYRRVQHHKVPAGNAVR